MLLEKSAMKNLLILCLVVVGVTSCSKDSFDLDLSTDNNPSLSEIVVRVSYLEWATECAPGCVTPEQVVTMMPNAGVLLFKAAEGNDQWTLHEHTMFTNSEGKAIIGDLPAGEYKVQVETPLGIKFRIITTQINKRSFIDFSF
jgi:hypothetical protein